MRKRINKYLRGNNTKSRIWLQNQISNVVNFLLFAMGIKELKGFCTEIGKECLAWGFLAHKS